jgi:organic hydroperoxide reductase OsmC/OhrA
MSDDFNMSMRKFLKQVGVTSQQEIERAVREARDAGSLGEKVHVRAVVTIDGLDMRHEVEGDIKTAGAPE